MDLVFPEISKDSTLAELTEDLEEVQDSGYPFLLLAASHNNQHFGLSVVPELIQATKKSASSKENYMFVQIQVVLETFRSAPSAGNIIMIPRITN